MNASRTSPVMLAIAGLAAATLTAHADDKKPPAAPTPAAPTPAQPAPPKPAPPKPPPAPMAPVAATPPAAVADHVKAMKGSWKCTGSTLLPDGTEVTRNGTLTVKVDLDGFWSHSTFTSKAKGAYKFDAYRTLDATSGKWHLMLVDSLGGQEVGTSAGPEGSKLVWLTDSRGPGGSRKARHTEQKSGTDLVFYGETTTDGKLWIKTYEVTCKK